MLKGKFKFIAGYVLMTIMLVLGIFAAGAYAGVTREWKFDDSKFSSISVNTKSEIDGLTVYPGIIRSGSLKLFKGTKYTNFLYMDISTDRNYRSVSFHLNGDSTIYIIGRSDGQDTDKRRLRFYFEETGETQYIEMGAPKGYKVEYRGEPTDVYLNAIDEDVRIYDIAVKDYDENEYKELDEGESYYWNLFLSGFTPKEYTSNVSFMSNVKNRELIGVATEEKPIKHCYGITTDSGYRFSDGIDLKGSGSRYYRTIFFDVPKNADIYITARTPDNGSENDIRYLYVTNEYECDIEDYDGVLQDSRLAVSGKTTTYRIRYRGNGERIYLKSQNEGIRIYKIEIAGENKKIIDDCKWIFDEYDELIVGNYLNNQTLDNMLISSNMTRPASVVASTSPDYKKAVQIISSYFGEASKIIFNVPNSANGSSDTEINSNRKIRVVAKGSDPQTSLILGDDYGYVYGSYKMTTDLKEYVFDYDGGQNKLYLFTYSGNAIHKNSEIYSISTSDLPLTRNIEISCSAYKDNISKYNFNVENISNPKDYYYIINYDSSIFTLMNIGMDYNNSDVITDPNVQVISNKEGEIKFKVLNLNEKDWSGTITYAVFKGKEAGSGKIKFTAVRG